MPFDLSRGTSQRIAIVGGGISGLASAWLLSKHHRITLFEAAPRLGGHARTVMAGRNGDRPVDTGFIVFNHPNYPGLTSMFRELDVPIQKSDMSFGVSLSGGQLEYGLRNVNTLFGQRANLVSPGFLGMIRDILRFNGHAEAASLASADLTIAGLLSEMRLGPRFRDHYLFPICGAIWSTPASGIGAFPAQTLLRFLRSHGLMSNNGQHQWWTVSGGSISYVSRLSAELRRRGVSLRTGTPVRSVQRDQAGVLVRTIGCEAEEFDQVIFACHADQALSLLPEPAADERKSLNSVRFQDNRVVLHCDSGVMPLRRRCWSSWIYRTDGNISSDNAIGVSYWMNQLQNIPATDPMFITLNPHREIPEAAIYDETVFRHPVFDRAALQAQDAIAAMQGANRTWYAGAWLRNGFHEDGFVSAADVASRMLPERMQAA